MHLRSFLLNDTNIKKNSYVWNMVGSMMMAFQSVIMLMVITRTLGIVDAGIFTIAFANANLFLTLGKYGMRYFLVSDVKKQFSFSNYVNTRIITCIAMMLVSVGYIIYAAKTNSYSNIKTQVCVWMCVFKVVDAVEDVYHGEFQRNNRLDIAARAMSLRMIITIITFLLAACLLRNLLYATIISTIVTTVVFVLITRCIMRDQTDKEVKLEMKNVWTLLRLNLPLCASAFLSFYIGNAPKYAIDRMLTDEVQACYGFVAMPVFVIGLLNNFIFNPMLFHLSVMWEERKIKSFVMKIVKQGVIIVGITVVCIAGAYVLGVPVLSILYNTDLAGYKTELLILLLGGGFLGLSGLLNAVITIIRFQNCLMWGYAMVALAALLSSNQVVQNYGVMGAAVLYAVLMAILCVVFIIFFIIGVLQKKNMKPESKEQVQ